MDLAFKLYKCVSLLEYMLLVVFCPDVTAVESVIFSLTRPSNHMLLDPCHGITDVFYDVDIF